MESSIKTMCFFLALMHVEEPSVWKDLEPHITGDYLIAKETTKTSHLETKGQHIHYLVNMELNEYNAFIKRMKHKYPNLRGKPTNGLPKTYGKINEIRSLEKLKSYLVKDCDDPVQTEKFNSLRTNYNLDSLNAYYALSYQKLGNREKWRKLLAYASDLLNSMKIIQRIKYNVDDHPGSVTDDDHIQILASCNQEYRRLNDGNSLTQASTLKILFHLEIVTDKTYMSNMYYRIITRN